MHFIRHGQAQHNALAAVRGAVKCACKRRLPDGYDTPQADCPYNADAAFDAALTDKGWEQAEKLSGVCAALGVQLVCSSPLRRTLQTALKAFGEAIDTGSAPPLITDENLREQIGMHLCDRRRDTAAIHAEHGARVNCDSLGPTDELWTEQRESKDSVAIRCATFIDWLMQRPEEHIAVTAHHHVLLVMFHCVLQCETEGAERLLAPFSIAEMRSVRLLPAD